jgi:hypothetical protein
MAARVDLLDAAGVAWIVSIDEEAEGVEREHLRIWRNPTAKSRVFLVDAPSGEVDLVEYAPGRAEAVIRLEQPARAVFAEVDHPGWRVDLDGAPVSHGRFEGIFPEVAVPAGRHVLRFEFDPTSYRLGAGVSVATAIALLISLARQLRTREHGG